MIGSGAGIVLRRVRVEQWPDGLRGVVAELIGGAWVDIAVTTPLLNCSIVRIDDEDRLPPLERVKQPAGDLIHWTTAEALADALDAQLDHAESPAPPKPAAETLANILAAAEASVRGQLDHATMVRFTSWRLSQGLSPGDAVAALLVRGLDALEAP